MCVRIVEPKGSLIPFDAVRANVRVPFALNPLRIGVMVVVLAMVLVWRPGSRLWRMPLDTTSVRQRAWLGRCWRCLLWSLVPLWCGSWWRRLR